MLSINKFIHDTLNVTGILCTNIGIKLLIVPQIFFNNIIKFIMHPPDSLNRSPQKFNLNFSLYSNRIYQIKHKFMKQFKREPINFISESSLSIENQNISIYFNRMPRTEHLNNIHPNRIYALDAQILYKHQTEKMTTAIIEQENVQSRIKIPNTMMMNGQDKDITEGCKYHFAFCYIAPNGWISVRHPNTTITQIEDQNQEEDVIVKSMPLPEIVNNCQKLFGHYLTTLLYVVAVNPVQVIRKGEKQLTLCVLNCYASGYLVDITLWNFDLPIHDLAGQHIVFSGFRLKKLTDWKFVFVSSVYSKIAKYEGMVQGIPFSPYQKYHNLSSIFEAHNISQLNNLIAHNDKLFSQVDAMLTNMNSYSYDGCSICKRKLQPQTQCPCNPESKLKLYTILKIILESQGNSLEATIFDEEIQNNLTGLNGPTRMKFNLKSMKKMTNETVQVSHIVTKILP